ncbi:CheY-like chemotaxis protein [Rhodoblastus acidophilus]|uniref:response regulator n=1 Tax=Rhodoblastus acidophilus TaxID=1074 RepID=UPI0022246122|nr:response regulator [Rhodoblastus acidophilus]MCW2318162.1 CheY-like chemotaxis protein [Rhodoblastus acidophilus]
MSIVDRIARLLAAEITFRSRDGRGSRFSISVQLDDAQSLRSSLQLLLEGWGYETVAAGSGEEALDLGAREGWRFDAIVADHRLGAGLSGTQTVNEIHARSGRKVPTIVITGDTSPDRIVDIHASGYVMLHKPVGANELRRTLFSLPPRGDSPPQSA